MSTSNRLKKGKKQGQTGKERGEFLQSAARDEGNQRERDFDRRQGNSGKVDRQSEFGSYLELSECNPMGVKSTCCLFPSTHTLVPQFNVPLGLEISPVLWVENPWVQTMSKSLDEIPKCQVCRACMNCYNQFSKNKYRCFLCGYDNSLPNNQIEKEAESNELQYSIYQTLSSPKFYPNEPAHPAFVFLIDISPESARTNALFYAVAALKEAMSRPEMDDICVYFFTFDEILHQYDLSGEEAQCTIYDKTIQKQTNRPHGYHLKDVRSKLLDLLDSLEEMSSNNPRSGSDFANCFDYVYLNLKQTGAKFFILQCNEAITGEPMFWESMSSSKQQLPSKNATINSIPSLFQTSNKTFFKKYSAFVLSYECSFSIFVFSTNFKNIKVLSDFMKLSCSEIKVYSKKSDAELMKFYYELTYLLEATYVKSVHCELIISRGWYFTSIYGNFRKLNERVTFTIPHLEPSRKILMLVSPSKYTQAHDEPPYCAIQLITNYRYKKQSFACVSTIIQPVTTNLNKLYAGINFENTSAVFGKMILSGLRMEHVNNARKQIMNEISAFTKSGLKFYHKFENFPNSINLIIMYVLASLKSLHSQPQMCSNTPTFDKIVAERNFLQSCGLEEMNNFFNPCLFDLNNLNASMCQEEGQFVYPPTLPLKFQNTRSGLFLLDNSLQLYIFIAKHCDPELFGRVFGMESSTKNEVLSEQLLTKQASEEAIQIQTLIRVLRQQKSYGWIPLQIVRCGEGSWSQKSYYLNYFEEKYGEFRNFNYTFSEFLKILAELN